MKTGFALGVLAAVLIPTLALVRADVQKPAPPPPPCNSIAHEPLLIYETLGSSLVAPYDSTLTVYSDGAVVLADAYATGRGKIARTHVTARAAFSLQQGLIDAGASTLCDEPQLVTDVPLHTLTLLNAVQDGQAHTFSYWIGDGGYATVDALLENFIAEQFPGF